MKKLIKAAIKYGPLLYPIVKKLMDEKKKKEVYTKRNTVK